MGETASKLPVKPIAKRSRKTSVEKGAPLSVPLDFGPLPDFLGFQLRRAQIAVFDGFIRNCAELGLRPGQFSVLLTIQHNPGRKQSEIAEALGIQRTNFVALADTLEKKGWLLREQSDRRSYALFLTPAGETLMNRAVELQNQLEGRLSKALGPGGRETLLKLLRQVTRERF